MLDPEGAALLAELTYEALKDDGLDYVGGLEMGAVPLAGAIAQLSWIKGPSARGVFRAQEAEEHGARLAVEGLAKGESLQGKRVVIVEDVTTTGGSALKAAEAVRDAGGEIALVFTMVDRDEGATEAFAEAGGPLLDCPRSTIEAWARARGLAWVEDESNAQLDFNRNHLRHRVLPVIGERFPAATATLARAAEHFREASELLDEFAALDQCACGGQPLQLERVLALSDARVANLLRWRARQDNFRAPPRSRLGEALRQLRAVPASSATPGTQGDGVLCLPWTAVAGVPLRLSLCWAALVGWRRPALGGGEVHFLPRRSEGTSRVPCSMAPGRWC